MLVRRNFLRLLGLSAAFPALLPRSLATDATGPVVISTWNFGEAANAAAWEILARQGNALDAVEAGARVPEADPDNHSVGLGGYPDRDGHVTLDACIMDHLGNLGSVACLEDVVHAVSVARRVMEKTPHVLLVGQGALQFALAEGFPREKLLTPEADKAWREWRKTARYKPLPNIEQSDSLYVARRFARWRKQPRHHRCSRTGPGATSGRCLHHQRNGIQAARSSR